MEVEDGGFTEKFGLPYGANISLLELEKKAEASRCLEEIHLKGETGMNLKILGIWLIVDAQDPR